MHQKEIRYTKLRWLLTVSGLFLYVADILTDLGLSVKYVVDERYVWSALTFGFVLVGMLVTQVFSYAWYKDDINDVFINPQGIAPVSGFPKGRLAVLHLCGAGIFTRYYQLIKTGFHVVWIKCPDEEDTKEVHHRLFCQATDLSMLKLFEAFLESVPQLLLQIYKALHHGDASIMQYSCMVMSCFNIAWAMVDYRRCLRRSLHHVQEMPSGLPTVIYLLYKVCTISSHVLSYSLLLKLSPYSVMALAILWLLGTIWSHLLQTNFCTTRGHEILYRAVVGFILTFTFFNVKGQDTRLAMTVYYFLYSLINMVTPILLALLMPEVQTATYFLAITGFIFGGSVLGLLFLVLYYLYLHPKKKNHEADEVDGLEKEAETGRIRHFLQP
ncbi:XK-related protein 9 [Nerophis lumbriciformis]|uniref:XK-related protein 9 n=1 Tax=Nerophis lumbriciformis TaxID=546530 RepID=UPI002ADF45C7|nr:XK-related protein 9 [Nerophis lumbriciformis]XP_061821398.1 XK-related protein 9 [Nerophis lumbriciformis]XP_061821399.1 XK-related protein 9 [Nerophis lumbriciformis]